ncbi:MAG: hypothetical protein ACO24S_06970, partial [Ilumatobacteraceae bacterium]
MRELPEFTRDESRPGDIWTAWIGDLELITGGGDEYEVVSVNKHDQAGSLRHIGKMLIDEGRYFTEYRVWLPFAHSS